MTTAIIVIFLLVYLGMILGRLPLLQLNRTGVALLGAIALVSINALSIDEAIQAIHLPTLILLFSFMVLSAQMRLGGFYDWVTHKLGRFSLGPAGFLGALILVAAVLSAVFSNDIVCLAMAPVLIDVCRKRQVAPIPHLLALACAANIGSAATLIGNPQNMLIGQTLNISFAAYLTDAMLPVGLGLLVCWFIIARQNNKNLSAKATTQTIRASESAADTCVIAFDRWQTIKGLLVAASLLLAFLFGPWPTEHVALIGAGILLTSRKLHSSRMLEQIDWELLILFMSLFIVNHALQKTGVTAEMISLLAKNGIHLAEPLQLFVTTFILSNVVSNVPAVMLLLPISTHDISGLLLALVSTFAGNLLIVGSIANIIVIDAAAKKGIAIDWRSHARVGVPITLLTLIVSAVYLALIA